MFFATAIPIIGILFLIYWKMRPQRQQSKVRFSRRGHFLLLALFMSLLLVLTIFSEAMQFKIQPAKPTNVSFETEDFDIIGAMINNEDIDPSLIIGSRNHKIGDELSIQDSGSSYSILIERKEENDGIIEETLYKPTLFSGNYDLSESISFNEPVWTGQELIIPVNEEIEVTTSTYYDTNLLSQLTKQGYEEHSGFEYGFNLPVVHLLVPKDLMIHTLDDSNVYYMDDF